MKEIKIEDFVIGSFFNLIPKKNIYYSTKNINLYGNIFEVLQTNKDFVLFESIGTNSKGKKFKRWVNIFYDEKFNIGDKVDYVKKEKE